jgi:DNA-binding response OmpR family regulator
MNGRVLLVTDNAQAGRIWAYALTHRGVDVCLVGSVQDALCCRAEEGFDAIVIDVYNEHLDGLALCRRFRSESDDPILLLTPRRDEAHLLAAYQAGVDECIVKPVSSLVFVAKVLARLRCRQTIPTQSPADEMR